MESLETQTGALRDFLRRHPRLVVLTGAGISAASGIPTYRDHRGNWRQGAPVLHRDFLHDAQARRRYWARSRHGWPMIRDALPNAAHVALADLEQRGVIELLITQNVDRLHQRAGSRRVVDLHGRLDRVRCLSCRAYHCRDSVQRLLDADGHRSRPAAGVPRPDGDMDVPGTPDEGLAAPQCGACAGDLMPDVVFFGGSVPRQRVARCMRALERADALLAVGSSLQVFSGFRFCRRIRELGKPLAIVNAGVTRADALADLHITAEAGPLLRAVVGALG